MVFSISLNLLSTKKGADSSLEILHTISANIMAVPVQAIQVQSYSIMDAGGTCRGNIGGGTSTHRALGLKPPNIYGPI